MTSDDFGTAAKKAAGRSAAAAADLQDDAQELGSTAAERAQAVAGQASDVANDLYGRAKDHVQGLAGRVPGSASEAYAAGQRAYTQGSRHISQQVFRQPIEALLLAGAIGYLVGWATSRS